MIPFNKAFVSPDAAKNVQKALYQHDLAGNGPWGKQCAATLERITGAPNVFLTPSCTAALEMAVMAAGIGPGDEVVMPSFTFSSTANAVVRAGATPLFVDIREDTLNLDEELVPTEQGWVIAVHYAGVPCELDVLRKGHFVIEDAAQALGSTYRGRSVGGLGGDMAAFSFHSTKNITCGEGGAVATHGWVRYFEIIQEKGTDRTRLISGKIDRYTWQDVGSSFLLGELSAAFLSAQLDSLTFITDDRMRTWNTYHQAFYNLEQQGVIRRPIVPEHVTHNAHMYYLLAANEKARDRLIKRLRDYGVQAFFHYVPLHSSPAGLRYGKTLGDMRVTNDVSARLLRLPLWTGMTETEVLTVIDAVHKALA